MPEFPTIASLWAKYLDVAMPEDAHETRRAFYAGASTLLGIMCRLAADEREVGDAETGRRVDALHAECLQFAEDVMAGRA